MKSSGASVGRGDQSLIPAGGLADVEVARGGHATALARAHAEVVCEEWAA
jgi:hypothetical protein